ncbi:LpqB family beta-propeller domain-containing protein [Solwaraspora sp. WMMD1047]|uniref:LpqB family beta-propeller domain-containing protein n=1 Tax=Solwaraspora sp. WMMD1047 TaxID=3016102 RepID=UPI002415DDEE|nr:LpqB family beta-propeller domain-containing protein [Solwaraspora sp. WMMD1047]MDG4833081.1 LpqB family beta-propeller domain-containing protein [Solwaraspora sp. WMMD1047]
MSAPRTRIGGRLVAALAAASLAVGLAGCGIPDQTDVQIDGRGPEPGTGAGDGTGSAPPGRLDAGDEVGQFAVNFLAAAAGEASGAYERVNAYLPEGRRHKPKPVNEVAINVVRLIDGAPRFTDSADGPSTVTIRVAQVGVLRADGAITEPKLSDTEYTFTVGRIEADPDRPGSGSGLYVLDPPPVLLMSTDALGSYYLGRTIYFWNADRTALVPDLRYMPVAVPSARQPTEVLNWLTGGPSEWLAGTAVQLPEGSNLIGNVTVAESGGRAEVNLSVNAGELDDEAELDQLYNQLAWSLRENLRGDLELKIQGQQRKVADIADHLDANPLYRVTRTPEPFCVYAGELHPLARPGVASTVPVADEANRNIRSAALARDGDQVWAALVTPAGDRWRLRAGAGTGNVSSFVDSTTTFATMGRPVWLKGSDPTDPTGLVVADGRLYRFGLDAVFTEVRLPNAAGAVTAVGAALDGHRIAFVAGNKLYVASLSTEGDTVTAGRARRLASTPREITGVDWNGENSLELAGVNDDQTSIYQTTTDGASERAIIPRVQVAGVTHVAAYPNNPVVLSPGGSPMYEGSGIAYSAGDRITAEEVTGETENPDGDEGNPTAPFFLY